MLICIRGALSVLGGHSDRGAGMVCQSTGKMGQTCRNDVGRVVRWRKWYLECVSAICVRSSGYNTKGRGCNVQERFRLRPSHDKTTAMATITEMTAIETVAEVACAARKTRNKGLSRVPATRTHNCLMQTHITETVTGSRSVGNSMWSGKK